MRLHSDILGRHDLINAAAQAGGDVYVYSMPHGSRRRHHAHEVALRGYGKRHTRRPNKGTRSGAPGHRDPDGMAATWSDWGRFLSALYAKDPSVIAPHYKDADDFNAQTHGLFAPGATVTSRTLADAVRESQAADPQLGRGGAIVRVSHAYDLPEYIVEKAIFGE